MTRRPRVPGLSDDWARQQLMIPSAPCPSCTVLIDQDGKVQGQPWNCDPDRPGCPLHDVPEQTREAPKPWTCNGTELGCADPSHDVHEDWGL